VAEAVEAAYSGRRFSADGFLSVSENLGTDHKRARLAAGVHCCVVSPPR